MNKENPLGLYEHNRKSYEKIKNAFSNGEKVVGIVHATGTGKTYNALQLVLEHPDKKVIFITPYSSIVEHIMETIVKHGLSLKKDFPNLTFMNYQGLVNLSREELELLPMDILILDEFHHIGAPVWGARIHDIIETHPELQILGMTAYTIRSFGTINERDMANPDGDELFSNKIVSRYDLCDGMLEGVLPKVVYRSAYLKMLGTLEALEERVKANNCTKKDEELYSKLLHEARKKIEQALSMPEVIQKFVKKDDKIIYFCPLDSNIEDIQAEAKRWFLRYVPEEDIVFYKSTSLMRNDGQKNREAFYHDKTLDGHDASHKLRVMFCINQYNEGVHAPDIDGVIMGRETRSDIVFFEQLGRALSVRGDTKKRFDDYSNYTRDELVRLCEKKLIPVQENMTKEALIEKLISPYVLDLANNIDFIKNLESELDIRAQEILKSASDDEKKKVKIHDFSFDIEIENSGVYEILKYISERLTMTWEDWYELAQKYYNHHGNLNVPERYKTTNGYEEDSEYGRALGHWLHNQRMLKKSGTLSALREEKLLAIGMIFDPLEQQWQEMYNLAKKYYDHHGNLNILRRFKTTNGYEKDLENGKNLGQWIGLQRKFKQQGLLSSEREEMLLAIGMSFENVFDARWSEMYQLAKSYYEHYGNLRVSKDFQTSNGYDFDKEHGKKLGLWLSSQKSLKKQGILPKEREEKLLLIGMEFLDKKEIEWQEMYNLAKKYYEHYGNLKVLLTFKTTNGYEEDLENGKNLGLWLGTQKVAKKEGTLSRNREKKLLAIGMEFENTFEVRWNEMYNLAKNYYEHYGNLAVPQHFVTSNGYDSDKSYGKKLGQWLSRQKSLKKQDILPKEREEKLVAIGMVVDVLEAQWNEMYDFAKTYYEHYGDLKVPLNFKTINGYEYDETGLNLGNWLNNQRMLKKNGTLSALREEKLLAIGMVFDPLEQQWQEMYNLAKKYFEYYGNLNIPKRFKTIDGYEEDLKNGKSLGEWISTQRRAKGKGLLNQEKEVMLLAIGMIFDIRKNTAFIKELCQIYGIDEKKNKAILKGISYREMIAKIKYLEERQLPIVTNGYLHEIFNISNQALQEKYGICLEELVNTYTLERGR